MFKTILIPTMGLSSDPAALEAALLVARGFSGHLECVHVRPDPQQILIQAAGYDMGMGMGTQMVMGDLIDVLQREDQKRTERAQKTFEAFCKREELPIAARPTGEAGVTAAWREVSGRESDILVAEARTHDLTVLGNATALGGMVREAAGTVLVNSGRPILLLPAKAPKKMGKSIAIAWKASPEAARAVAAAMPLLTAAARVTIVSIAENEDETASGADALSASLRWHGINAEISYMAHPAGSIHDTILRAAADAKADLLVMGAYGHSRLSEFVFGGFTRHVLGGAVLPTLLAH
ncbi:universal stress protein [Parvibaculum sp.]|uniref:universal stress protein n=1 Tax=Parvibaculum sp. TaxID=2024848 RepID=UPI002CE0430B|nr:universal stress protein [Parvibaculum sp.]HUD51371.1 universal stress protein [Parvibaculum sp.]